MKTRRILISSLLFLTVAGLSGAQETELPFSMPTPEGWRTETLPFPLEFAPDLPYTGLEELRFAPGMMTEGSEEFWTYAFVWWIEPDQPSDLESLTTHLRTYFRGLAVAVAEQRGFSVGDAAFDVSLQGDEAAFGGAAETFDPFVTRDQVRLNIHGGVLDCPDQDRKVVLFILSPQEGDHPIWSVLGSIRGGFRCGASG